MQKDYRITIKGTSPLLQHNQRGADPLDPYTRAVKAIATKKRKTEDDLFALAKAEWECALYHTQLPQNGDKGIGAYAPGHMFEAMLRRSAVLRKRGMDVKRALLVLDDSAIEYNGPREPEKMWEAGTFRDTRSVVVSGRRIMRTRPIFRDWGLSFVASVESEVWDEGDLRQIAEDAGRFIGLGDYRPRFGRFVVKSLKAI